MSHSVIYVLFKSSKVAAPGMEIVTVKVSLYISSQRVEQGMHAQRHVHTLLYTLKQNTMMPYLVLEKGIHHISDTDCSETSRLARKYQTKHPLRRLQCSDLAAISTWLSCLAISTHAPKYPRWS